MTSKKKLNKRGKRRKKFHLSEQPFDREQDLQSWVLMQTTLTHWSHSFGISVITQIRECRRSVHGCPPLLSTLRFAEVHFRQLNPTKT